MDIQAYLDRIGYRGPLTPTAETLRSLQVAHLQTVPFENLSIHSGQPIVLDDESLFDKVVVRRRGGFCYELNGLFAALLRALGFQVTKLSAGVACATSTRPCRNPTSPSNEKVLESEEERATLLRDPN